MKTLINRSFLILMFIAVFSGCEFNSVESPDSTATIDGVSTETIAREIGRQHNAGLDFILQQMKMRREPFRDREEALNFFRVSTEKFIQATAGADQGRIAEFFDLDRTFDKPVKASAGYDEGPGLSYDNPTLKLSRDQTHHLKSLFEVYSDYNDDNVFEQDHTQILNVINRDLNRSYSSEQVLLIQGVTETLKASFNYWKENRAEWIKEVARLHYGEVPAAAIIQAGDAAASPCAAFPQVPMCNAINWEDVIVADGGGLIDGVVGNALYWIVAGPPGWIAGAAILGGGVAAASTAELYHQIMDLL